MVKRHKMDDSVLMNDYMLLEDVARASDAAFRQLKEVSPRLSSTSRSKRAVFSKEAARRNIHYHEMPQGMSRRLRNTSHLRGRGGACSIFWHVDVTFVRNGVDMRVSVDSFSEKLLVQDLVIGARDSRLSRKRKRSSQLKIGILQSFDGVPAENLDVFLGNEHVVGQRSAYSKDPTSVTSKALGEDDTRKYVRVDKVHTLENVLQDRTIVEYPMFHVCLCGSDDARKLERMLEGVFEKPDDDDGSSDCSSSESASDGEIPEDEGSHVRL